MPDGRAHLRNCLMVLWSWSSRIVRSVTTMTDSNTLLVLSFKPDKLMREPCDGIGLAAPRRVLDQVPLSSAVFA